MLLVQQDFLHIYVLLISLLAVSLNVFHVNVRIEIKKILSINEGKCETF